MNQSGLNFEGFFSRIPLVPWFSTITIHNRLGLYTKQHHQHPFHKFLELTATESNPLVSLNHFSPSSGFPIVAASRN
jgi:hypothetical protein